VQKNEKGPDVIYFNVDFPWPLANRDVSFEFLISLLVCHAYFVGLSRKINKRFRFVIGLRSPVHFTFVGRVSLQAFIYP